jgi:hypothetical protein
MSSFYCCRTAGRQILVELTRVLNDNVSFLVSEGIHVASDMRKQAVQTST